MGRFYLRSHGRHSMQMAADLFRRATELDPKFARAWANLALAHSLLRTRGKTDVSFKDIEGFIATALQLDDNLAEAYTARAELLLRHLDVTAAEVVARRAIELDPTLHDAHYALAESLRRSRRFEEAARVYEAAIPLDDEAWGSAAQGSWCYEAIGDLDLARRLGLQGLKRLERAMSLRPRECQSLLGRVLFIALSRPTRQGRGMGKAFDGNRSQRSSGSVQRCLLLPEDGSNRLRVRPARPVHATARTRAAGLDASGSGLR